MKNETVEIVRCSPDQLCFDPQNPRLVGMSPLVDEIQILNRLWIEMNVKELVMSILANGFFETEALYVVEEKGKKVVVEGNRRLAAVKAILNPELIKNGAMAIFVDQITEEIRQKLKEGIPVIYQSSREESWRYIGFKHVNGAVKWDSLAKAKYIALVHNEYKVPIEQIAEQIGDSNRTIAKLYQGLMVLEQAERETEFRIDDVDANKLYFSHLYTALMYEGYQKYISFNPNNIGPNPIPNDSIANLQELMYWIYGSKSKSIRPIVQHQNPDLRKLESALRSTDSIQLLRAGRPLEVAYEKSLNPSELLYKSIVLATENVQTAMSKIASYDGSLAILDAVKQLAENADILLGVVRSQYSKKEENGL